MQIRDECIYREQLFRAHPEMRGFARFLDGHRYLESKSQSGIDISVFENILFRTSEPTAFPKQQIDFAFLLQAF